MMRLQINRLERSLLDAERQKFRQVILEAGDFSDLLEYVHRLERTIRDGLSPDDRTIADISDRVRDSVRDSLSGISFDASHVVSSALRNLPAKGHEVLA
jgi:hypothetical protein